MALKQYTAQHGPIIWIYILFDGIIVTILLQREHIHLCVCVSVCVCVLPKHLSPKCIVVVMNEGQYFIF